MNNALKGESYLNEANTSRFNVSKTVSSRFGHTADDAILEIASPKRRNYELDLSRSSEHTFDERSHKALIYTVCCSFNEDEDLSESTTYSVFTESQLESPERPARKKSVRFSDTTIVREFSITVGDPALSADSCPLTLDWMFSEKNKRLKDSTCNKNVRRLSVNQRRERVAQVQGISINEVISIEIERVLERVEDTMVLQETYIDHLIQADEESESGGEWINHRALNIDGIREYRDETNQSSRAALSPHRDLFQALPDESDSGDSLHWLMNASLREIDIDSIQ